MAEPECLRRLCKVFPANAKDMMAMPLGEMTMFLQRRHLVSMVVLSPIGRILLLYTSSS